jgi:uncharacterized membrane protein YozB (DUF420 family)
LYVVRSGLLGVFPLFLSGFHARAGVVRFSGHGPIRPAYLTILITHTILAVVIVPLVLITLTFALRRRFRSHKAIARWTLPIWLYVSVTGVIVYGLLFVFYKPIASVPGLWGTAF